MKTLFVALAALMFAFFLGCQNSITDPVMPETNVVSKDVFNFTYPNVIGLKGWIYDPSHRSKSFAEISGVVRYKIQEVSTDGTPADLDKTAPNEIFAAKNLKVSLFVDADLKINCRHKNLPSTVNGTAESIVEVNRTDQSDYYIEKSFKVENTCCRPLDLILKFRVSDKQLELVSMRLFINEY